MKPEYALPVRYVLYTHYPEGNDFNEFRTHKKPANLPGVRFLVRHLSGLRGLLTWPGYEGLLVIFYSPGLHECLESMADHKSGDRLQETCKELRFAKAVHEYVDGVIKAEYQDLLPRFRFITAFDLYTIFGRITESNIADRLKRWIVGDIEGIRYDSPKIVEAIVRLRLLGSGVPVFRVDHDVLLRGEENWDKKNLEFSSTIGSCLTAYQLRRDSPNLSSFIFSASYDHKILNDPAAASDVHAWGRAYATRVFPALPFDKKRIAGTLSSIEKGSKAASRKCKGRVLIKKKKEVQTDAWDRYTKEAFSPSLARKFFGFEGEKFVTSPQAGIGHVGAHPATSVISGAMFYLSDGAILDLPPFSNFSLNVSWIDDHLKYCLHRELRHLRRPTSKDTEQGLKNNALLAYSKIDDVIVQKAGRKIEGDLRWYLFNVYLPTLLRGTILDAWITPDPLLKYRPEELAEKKQRQALNRMRRGKQSRGLLPSALQRALEACKFRPADQTALEEQLRQAALARITQVRRQWATLTGNGVDTFASIWAKGRAQLSCPDLKLKYSGLVIDPHLPASVDLTWAHLSQPVALDVINLIKDANNYIEWTLDWPAIVQVVRSIEQGTLRTDLNYVTRGSQTALNPPIRF